MLDADIEQLRQLSTTIKDVGTKIDEIDVRTTGDAISVALPGCDIGSRCATAGEYIEGAWLRVAWRLAGMSTLITSCADNYAMTDEQFKQQLAGLTFGTSGADR
ncbi:hypothetical protein [Nocardia salmonicida]|uniref:hypothetical protein n=1 Tax=Nocardia salmonicida TaxID=53431 RepID=UPI0007A40EE4|nr:hypothetical protein [Nocardia salmonicida]